MANATDSPPRSQEPSGCDHDDQDDRSSPTPSLHACGRTETNGDCPMTSLGEYLSRYPKADRRLLCQQISIQLAMYHSVHKVVHGDVKMANVVVNERGVAILPKSGKTVPITSQPRAPTSPEERLPMTTATDLYAFSWLVFQVYTDIDPLELARDAKNMHLIASGVKPNRPGPETLPARRGLDDEIWKMMLKCWSISPVERPKATEVVHAFDIDLGSAYDHDTVSGTGHDSVKVKGMTV